jgi:hypothetical protein
MPTTKKQKKKLRQCDKSPTNRTSILRQAILKRTKIIATTLLSQTRAFGTV